METNAVAKASPVNVGLRYGIILGLISITISLVEFAVGFNMVENSWVNNVINFVMAVVVLVLAHKNFKDTGNGYMSYGQGLGISIIMTIVSMIIGGIFSYIYFNYLDPAAFEAIWEKAAEDMEEKGQSAEQIEMGLGIARKFFWVFFIVGGLFWGCIIGLIVSIFTQKKEPETAF